MKKTWFKWLITKGMLLERIWALWVIGRTGNGDSTCQDAVHMGCRVYDDMRSHHQRGPFRNRSVPVLVLTGLPHGHSFTLNFLCEHKQVNYLHFCKFSVLPLRSGLLMNKITGDVWVFLHEEGSLSCSWPVFSGWGGSLAWNEKELGRSGWENERSFW